MRCMTMNSAESDAGIPTLNSILSGKKVWCSFPPFHVSLASVIFRALLHCLMVIPFLRLYLLLCSTKLFTMQAKQFCFLFCYARQFASLKSAGNLLTTDRAPLYLLCFAIRSLLGLFL